MKTEKLYYQNQFLSNCTGVVIAKNENGLVFDRTVAYPEGGGQIGDRGKLIRKKTGEEIEFFDTTKIKGRNIYLDDFPVIKVENEIVHHIAKEKLEEIEIGEEFEIKIDIKLRASVTLHHSGLHLALMVLEKMRNGIDKKIIGAKINSEYGRLDFSTEEKFTKEELSNIEEECQKYIDENIPTLVYPNEKEPEALYWKCLDYIVPCGGTHCEYTGELGEIKVKRKNIGKTSERLIIELKNYEEFEKKYI